MLAYLKRTCGLWRRPLRCLQTLTLAAGAATLPTACIEPPLHLPAEDVILEMPNDNMDLEVVCNVDSD
ncbi:MAG: hypothetical protein MR693_01790, partial [Bacteroidales bacterium]|nr:hypothetical protein [Bacteroidales bacterium]